MASLLEADPRVEGLIRDSKPQLEVLPIVCAEPRKLGNVLLCPLRDLDVTKRSEMRFDME